MSLSVDPKPPGATMLYSRDWSGDLSTGETISTSTWSFSSTDLTQAVASISGTVTSLLIGGGVEGQTYYVTNTITTSLGQNLYRVGELRVMTEGVNA